MKILWLSHLVPYPPKGGVLQRSFNLLREVSKDSEVFLLAFNQKALLPTKEDIEKSVTALRKYCVGIEVIPLPSDQSSIARKQLIFKSIFTRQPYTVNWNYSPAMKRYINKVLNTFDPNLIHYDTIGLAQYFQYGYKKPQVLNHHNLESAMMYRRARKEKHPLKKAYFFKEARKIENFEKRICNLFNCNLTVSNDDSLKLKQIAPEVETAVIPNGVDISCFRPSNNGEDEETLIFAGGMNWYPNRDAMVFFANNIWPLLKNLRPSVKMIVIGQSPPKKLIELSQSDPNFEVTGYVDDVRPYFDKASVYVCPIRDGGGTRLKILDALSSGKPIVATQIAAEGIEVRHGKNIIIADTPEEITENIIRLLEDHDLRKKLSIEGRRLVENNYDWSIIGRKLNDLYSSLVK